MLGDEKAIDTLIVFSLDRLGRSIVFNSSYRDAIQAYGMEIVTVTGTAKTFDETLLDLLEKHTGTRLPIENLKKRNYDFQ